MAAYVPCPARSGTAAPWSWRSPGSGLGSPALENRDRRDRPVRDGIARFGRTQQGGGIGAGNSQARPPAPPSIAAGPLVGGNLLGASPIGWPPAPSFDCCSATAGRQPPGRQPYRLVAGADTIRCFGARVGDVPPAPSRRLRESTATEKVNEMSLRTSRESPAE